MAFKDFMDHIIESDRLLSNEESLDDMVKEDNISNGASKKRNKGEAKKKGGKSSRRSKPVYKPSEYIVSNGEEYGEKELKQMMAQLERDKARERTLSILSIVWTLASTIYLIVTTCIFISGNYVNKIYSIVLVSVMVAYVAAFIALLVFAFNNPKKGKKHVSTYKKLLSIIKNLMNIGFLVFTAVNMAAAAKADAGAGKWVLFIFTLLIAVGQLAIRVTMLVISAVIRRVARRYRVRVTRYIDGVKQDKNFRDSFREKRFR